MKSRRDKGRLSPFVPLIKATMKTDAWRALSHGARSLYAALRARYNTKLQNAVYLSTREAAKELGSHSHRDNVRRWFRELDYYGFIRMVSPAHHGVNGHGRAPHYRLTEEFYLGQTPTRDYLNWSSEPFREQKNPKHYHAKNRSRGPDGWSTLAQTGGPVIAPADLIGKEGGPNGWSMSQHNGGPDGWAITSLTTPLAVLSPLTLAAQRQRLNDLRARLAVFASYSRGVERQRSIGRQLTANNSRDLVQ